MAQFKMGWQPRPGPAYTKSKNLVKNPSFSDGENYWAWGVSWFESGEGTAVKVASGVANSLVQTALGLITGATYEVAFDMPVKTGTMTVSLGGTIQSIPTTPGTRQVFTMVAERVDQLIFDGTGSIEIDNVSVIFKSPAPINKPAKPIITNVTP